MNGGGENEARLSRERSRILKELFRENYKHQRHNEDSDVVSAHEASHPVCWARQAITSCCKVVERDLKFSH